MRTQQMISSKQIIALQATYRKKGLNEEDKCAMLHNYTKGRTTSTKELTALEARSLLLFLQKDGKRKSPLAPYRAAVLAKLEAIGWWCVKKDGKTDYETVNAICFHNRLAGKSFFELKKEELIELRKKLEMILKRKECKL